MHSTRYKPKALPRPSIALQQKKMAAGIQKSGNLEHVDEQLDYMGLLPETMVMPKDPIKWLDYRLLKRWAILRFSEWYTYGSYLTSKINEADDRSQASNYA